MVAYRSTDTSGRITGLLIRCVLYSLLSLGLIVFDKRYDHLGQIRRFLSLVAYPLEVAVASPFQGWDWFRESVASRDTLRADKAKLEAALRLANFRLQRYEALEAETQRLRALRENTAEVATRFVVGNIMDLDLDAFRERVLVDKGARDGVFVGQAVLDAGGVYGQVARVEELTSEVILLSDASHAIPVQINRNGLRTIAVGTGDMSRLKLPYLSTSADVIAGDLLVTSGLGGGFPAGYPVGTVSEVRRDPAQSLAGVEARPAAALDRSREVMFVWPKLESAAPETPAPPSAAPPAAAKPPNAAKPSNPAPPAPPKPPAATKLPSAAPFAVPKPADATPPAAAKSPSARPPAAGKDTNTLSPAAGTAPSTTPPAGKSPRGAPPTAATPPSAVPPAAAKPPSAAPPGAAKPPATGAAATRPPPDPNR
jgi:rod shape-determining protein MreC